MKSIDIDRYNIEGMRDLIPPDVAENIGRTWYRGLVAGEEGNSAYRGILIWEYKNAGSDSMPTESEIVWASGDEQKTLDLLFSGYNERIAEEHTVRSGFEFSFPPPEDAARSFFPGEGFSLKETESRDIFVTVQELSDLKLSNKEVPFYIKAIDKLNTRQFRNGVVNCLYSGRKGLLEDMVWLSRDFFDQEVSACVVMDEKAQGFLLVHETASGVLVVEFLFANSVEGNKDVLEMVRFSIRAAARKFPPETKVLLRRHNPSVKALVDKLFPGKKGAAAISGERAEAEKGGAA